MIERVQKFMPTSTPSPGHFAPDTNGTSAHTPRTPLSARRQASGTLTDGGEGESEVDRRQRDLYSKQQHILREQRSADQEKLIKAISGTLQAISALHAGCSSIIHRAQELGIPKFDRYIILQSGWPSRYLRAVQSKETDS